VRVIHRMGFGKRAVGGKRRSGAEGWLATPVPRRANKLMGHQMFGVRRAGSIQPVCAQMCAGTAGREQRRKRAKEQQAKRGKEDFRRVGGGEKT